MSLASLDSVASGRDDVSGDTTPRSGMRPPAGGPRAGKTNPVTSPAPLLGFDYEFQLEPRPQRRRRSSGGDVEEAKRYCLAPPRPQRDSAPRSRGPPTSPTFAEATRRSPPQSQSQPSSPLPPRTTTGVSARLPPPPVQPTATTSTAPAGAATSTSPKPQVAKKPKKPRFPPLVVETLPNWATHFRAISAKLGRPPNARPYGGGVRFSPESEDEYRLVQRYLTGLEKDSGVSWFAYSLPAERNLKIAIRGLPADTDPKEIEEELKAMGYEPEYVRHIKGAQGRPGCVFHAVIKRTPDVRAIYDTSVFMLMRGVKIEAWRGKRGPAQCHRCQRFRHSSHQCHRPLACVRCGGEHAARDCPRPREEPATCANCGGPHPACNIKCPVFQAELQNRRAGPAAITATTRRPTVAPERREIEEPEGPKSVTLMAAANGPTDRSKPSSSKREGKKKRSGGRKKGKKPEPPAATLEEVPTAAPVSSGAQAVDIGSEPERTTEAKIQTAGAGTAPRLGKETGRAKTLKQSLPSGGAAGADTTKKEFTACAIQLLMDLIKAIRQGQDVETVILDGLATLLTLYHG